MPAGDFFGGFAKALTTGLLRDQEQKESDAREQRRLQIELLQQQANRPDLRPELRPIVMDNLIKLAGLDNKGKKKGEFDAAMKTVLGMLSGPTEVTTMQNQKTGELPSAANMARTPSFVPTTVGPTADGYLPIPGTPEYSSQAATKMVPQQLPLEANPVGTSIIESVPTRRTVTPFMSPGEMREQQLATLRGQLQLQKEFDKTPDKNWVPFSDVFTDEGGNNRIVMYNPATGETKTVDAPKGLTRAQGVQQIRNVGTNAKRAAATDKKLYEEARELAIIGTGKPTPSDGEIEQYLDDAATNLQRRKLLNEQYTVANTGSRRAQTQGTLANIPTRTQPNVPEQREFSQITTQISELEKERDAVNKKGGARAMLGKKLKDGTVIDAEAMRDPNRAIKLREQYLGEIDEQINTLRAQRSTTSKPSVPKAQQDKGTGGKNLVDILGRQTMDLPMGMDKKPGETFTVGPHTFKVLAVIRPGRVRVERIK